jgi:hypothetical protein
MLHSLQISFLCLEHLSGFLFFLNHFKIWLSQRVITAPCNLIIITVSHNHYHHHHHHHISGLFSWRNSLGCILKYLQIVCELSVGISFGYLAFCDTPLHHHGIYGSHIETVIKHTYRPSSYVALTAFPHLI